MNLGEMLREQDREIEALKAEVRRLNVIANRLADQLDPGPYNDDHTIPYDTREKMRVAHYEMKERIANEV